MLQFKDNTPERKAALNSMPTETVEEFLARGGKISTTKTKKKLNAQALLDAAVGTPMEQEVIKFLASQGIDVE